MQTQPWFIVVMSALLCVNIAAPASAATESERADVAAKAYGLLKERCYKCHGQDSTEIGLDITRHADLILPRANNQTPFLTPRDPQLSMIYLEIKSKRMPLDGQPFSESEIQVIEEWINNGADFPLPHTREERPLITELDLIKAIRDDLNTIKSDRRRNTRYFSLAHVHNDLRVTDADVRQHRAALSKVLNALSRAKRILVPETVGKVDSDIHKAKVLYRINLEDFDWREDEWANSVVKAYPYGIEPNATQRDLIEPIKEIKLQYGSTGFDGVPYFRADWFTIMAAQAPIYDVLADHPKTRAELEKRLGFSIDRNIQKGDVARAAVQKSGVSRHNRVVEGHQLGNGRFFWLSYDFKSSSGRGNAIKFPLGPKTETNAAFADKSFDHAGGEIIYTRDNGLHGYMLTDEKGNRIDAGPVEIVFDRLGMLGRAEIVNAVKCMICHKHGMIDSVRDAALRANTLEAPADLERLEQLYSQTRIDNWLREDKEQYKTALAKAIGPFLLPKEKERLDVEPISVVARHYEQNLDLSRAAYELGLLPNKFENKLDGNPALEKEGLGPLLQNDTIKRSDWDGSADVSFSVFQRAAAALGLGSPRK